MKLLHIFPILLIAFALTGFSQPPPSVPLSTYKAIKTDVELVPCENKDRLEGVRKLFTEKGADESDVKIEDFGHVENLVIENQGNGIGTVIIGAHYDQEGGGCGAIDNWTGIVVLANVYNTMRTMSTNKSYKFVAFGKEEQGLIGSKAMANAIPKDQRENYCAMVNLDSFGFSYPQFMPHISDQRLLKLGKEISMALKLPSGTAGIDRASSDSLPFIENKIPAISVHGLSNNWQSILHTKRDQVKNINHASVYYGYRFTLSFVIAIDAEPCDAFRKKK